MTAAGAATAVPGGRAAVAALVAKDLRTEARGRDTLPPMAVFAVTVTLLLSFALPPVGSAAAPARVPPGTAAYADVLAGWLWITVVFAGLLAFARTFEVDRADGAVEPLLLAPVDRAALYVAKAATNLAYIATVEALLVPLFALLFGLPLGSSWPAVAVVVVLVDVGFVAAGTLFAAAAARTRSRELLLPVLALPALIPAFIAGVELTSDLFVGGGFAAVADRGWFVILCAFDVVFAVAGYLLFEYVLE